VRWVLSSLRHNKNEAEADHADLWYAMKDDHMSSHRLPSLPGSARS
jgi:hypothetical protein